MEILSPLSSQLLGFCGFFFFFQNQVAPDFRSRGKLAVDHVDSSPNAHTQKFSLSLSHTHTNTPKLDTWSVDAGAFPKGPCSVHLTVGQLLMRASKLNVWRVNSNPRCLHFHSSSKFKHTLPEPLLLLLHIGLLHPVNGPWANGSRNFAGLTKIISFPERELRHVRNAKH